MSSKPNHNCYEIIRSSWMCSFIKEVEHHVLHFLHNKCKDKVLKKMTLFNIKLAKKIIPECLRLGDIFFSHMTIFGTISKRMVPPPSTLTRGILFPVYFIWVSLRLEDPPLTTLDHHQWTLVGRYIMCHLIMELCR